MQFLIREIKSLCAALIFFTRLPWICRIRLNSEDFQRAMFYFPFAGWIVGIIAASVWWSCSLILPPNIAILFSMAASILLTGALHEDGLADVCDGFGAGHTREKILAIMKDSSIGVYGVLGLILILMTKWQTSLCLSEQLCPRDFAILIVVSHSLSRANAGLLTGLLRYARSPDQPSKSRDLITRLPLARLICMLLIGVAPLALLPQTYLWALIPLSVWQLATAWFLYRKIGGFTGDCLGATQQISEQLFLISALTLPWMLA